MTAKMHTPRHGTEDVSSPPRQADPLQQGAQGEWQAELALLLGGEDLTRNKSNTNNKTRRDVFLETMLSFYPGIRPDYVVSIGPTHDWDPSRCGAFICDELDAGRDYPKLLRKRKRNSKEGGDDGDEKDGEDDDGGLGDPSIAATHARFANAQPGSVTDGRVKSGRYHVVSKRLLMQLFPETYSEDVGRWLQRTGRLYTAYLDLERATRGDRESSGFPPVRRKSIATRAIDPAAEVEGPDDVPGMTALEEFYAARARARAVAAKAGAEARNWSGAEADGTMTECACCFDEFPRNRMAHCNKAEEHEDEVHWFCRNCLNCAAEAQVGLSKYDLRCMSTDGCGATFSAAQQRMFLEKKLRVALGRLEQEHAVRMANIQNLETCPFCHYAAVYPPVHEHKEFVCQAPGCEIVSCRKCRKETHIPKSCEEATRDAGYHARHEIEEARSQAIIRHCNKCHTPFIKLDGCNKMTCTRPGCGNVQCYVCSKSCNYNHFKDARGDAKGNCPLWDNVENRHETEVQVAGEEARKRVMEQHPGVDASVLDITLSDRVRTDEQRRADAILRGRPHPLVLGVRGGGGGAAAADGPFFAGGAGGGAADAAIDPRVLMANQGAHFGQAAPRPLVPPVDAQGMPAFEMVGQMPAAPARGPQQPDMLLPQQQLQAQPGQHWARQWQFQAQQQRIRVQQQDPLEAQQRLLQQQQQQKHHEMRRQLLPKRLQFMHRRQELQQQFEQQVLQQHQQPGPAASETAAAAKNPPGLVASGSVNFRFNDLPLNDFQGGQGFGEFGCVFGHPVWGAAPNSDRL